MLPRLFALPLLAAALSAGSALAQPAPFKAPPELGTVQVLPTRVVLDDRERAASVTLINNGDKPKTYRLSFVEMKMNEHGGLEQLAPTDSYDHSAAQYIRFSPRQVTLEPKVSQTVRIQLRKPADLPAGEYRSHLVMRAVPDASDSADAVEAHVQGVDLKLVPVYGVSIPVIFRQGDGAAQLSLSDLSVSKDAQGNALELKLNRAGERSGYGDLSVTFVPDGGAEVPVALQKGIGIYVPNAFRQMRLSLPPTALSHGKLRARFSEPSGGPVLAEAELQLH